MSDDQSEYAVSEFLGIFAGIILILLLAWLLVGCTSAKPCPPTPAPEVIHGPEVPVAIPCPAPKEINEYKPLLPKFDPEIADVDSLLKVLGTDYVRLVKSNHELAEKLRVYASPTPTATPSP